jgi:hypothetical protein
VLASVLGQAFDSVVRLAAEGLFVLIFLVDQRIIRISWTGRGSVEYRRIDTIVFSRIIILLIFLKGVWI